MAMRIALVGCGAIGTALLELVKDDAGLAVAAIVAPAEAAQTAQAVAQRLAPQAQPATAVPAQGIDLVIEAAGHAAIEEHVLPALQRGIPCIVASVGALSAEGLPERLEAAARAGGTRVELIAGAIGGIDALAAARVGGLDAVRYTGRKPPQAWKGTPAERECDLDHLTTACCIFDGTAEQAAQLYPKNANVAATLSNAAGTKPSPV